MGSSDGEALGDEVGITDGIEILVENMDGRKVGLTAGAMDGVFDGRTVGRTDGLGTMVGCLDFGLMSEKPIKSEDGLVVGTIDGSAITVTYPHIGVEVLR